MGDIYFVQSDVATRVTLAIHPHVFFSVSFQRQWVDMSFAQLLWNSFKVDALLGFSVFYLFLFPFFLLLLLLLFFCHLSLTP